MANSAMQDLMIDQLRDLYDAEKQLAKALPKLAKAATDPELAQGFKSHLEQTKGHAQRLEQIFEKLGLKAKSKPCEAMKGLVKEGQEAIEEDLDAPVGDIALIAAARRVEHYEMAAYETLVMATQAMKHTEVASLLQETLKEEGETDKRLSTVAKRLLKEGLKPKPEPDEEKAPAAARKKASPPSKATAKKGAAPKTANTGPGEHVSHTSLRTRHRK
jgi:ferritin-like metal-binding protein YciE